MASKLWSVSVGSYGCTVAAKERKRGGNITLYWKSAATGKQRTETLAFGVRDPYGRELGKAVQRVTEIATQYSEDLQRGIEPIVRQHASGGENPDYLKQGLDLYFALGTGAYRKPTKHYKQRLKDASYFPRILGADFRFSNLLPTTGEVVWRWFLERSKAGERARTAERAVDTLYQIARWLHERYPDVIPRVEPMRGWKARLADEWEEEFRDQLVDPEQSAKELRHTPADVERIFQSLHRADPRLALLLDAGAELREGQVARTRRSAVDLTPNLGRWGLGRLTVRGAKKKRGAIIDLHPELRDHLEHAWGPEGYLQELETAYRRGEIEDYYLFQHGRMRKKSRGCDVMVVPLDRHLANAGPMDVSTLVPIFHAFEKQIGIVQVPGRAFYGLRRVLADIAPAYTNDDRVLDCLTGHEPRGSTRRVVYQNRWRDEDIAGAAEVRRMIRLDARKGMLQTIREPRSPAMLTIDQLGEAIRALPKDQRETARQWFVAGDEPDADHQKREREK